MSVDSVLTHAEEDVSVDTGVDSGKLAIWLFLASEVMFFSGLICSYIVLRYGLGDRWPPPGVLNIPLTGLNTFLLICSSVTMVKSLSAAHRDDKAGVNTWLGCTIIFGMIFLSVQAYEYNHLYHGHLHEGHEAHCKVQKKADGKTLDLNRAFGQYLDGEDLAEELRNHGLTPQGSLYGACFYSMTGFHGAHVTGGVVWLICIFYQAVTKRKYNSRRFAAIELAGLYWHFVDLVWIILFTIVYLI